MIVDTNIAIPARTFHPLQGQPASWIAPMNVLSRDKQIAVISALTEGCSIRATERLTGIHADDDWKGIFSFGRQLHEGTGGVHQKNL